MEWAHNEHRMLHVELEILQSVNQLLCIAGQRPVFVFQRRAHKQSITRLLKHNIFCLPILFIAYFVVRLISGSRYSNSIKVMSNSSQFIDRGDLWAFTFAIQHVFDRVWW